MLNRRRGFELDVPTDISGLDDILLMGWSLAFFLIPVKLDLMSKFSPESDRTHEEEL